MPNAQRRKKEYLAMALIVVLMIGAYALIWSQTGNWPVADGKLKSNPYNSYAHQAYAWTQGRADVDDMPNLELANYNGKFYVSFPPLPSVVLLPFAFFMKTNTPDQLLNLLAAILGALLAYRAARLAKRKTAEAIMWAMLVTLGSNLLYLSLTGWVWFMAQTFSFTLSMAALCCALSPKVGVRRWSLFWLACAVGCRPFQIVFFPFLLILLYQMEGKPGIGKMLKTRWDFLIAPAVVAILLAGYNVLRFGDPVEFGHNHLPEFRRATEGQFSLKYVWPNFQRSIHVLSRSDADHAIITFRGVHYTIPQFNGWAFYLCMPVYLSCTWHFLKNLVTQKRQSLLGLVCLLSVAAALFLTYSHSTMGGLQFGCRYLVDATPFALGYVLLTTRGRRMRVPDMVFLALGLLVNVAGLILWMNIY